MRMRRGATRIPEGMEGEEEEQEGTRIDQLS